MLLYIGAAGYIAKASDDMRMKFHVLLLYL